MSTSFPHTGMGISTGALFLNPRSDARRQPMPIDYFLKSLAEDRKSKAAGVILSETASDGTLGLQPSKSAGGITFAQDEKSARCVAL